MDATNLTVRCMAWVEDGVWVAACIDLCLAVQDDTQEAATQRLHEQIAEYINEAVSIDAAHGAMLLTRKAPWRDRLRFWFWSAASDGPELLRDAAASVRRLAYREPLPLRVA